MKKTILLTLMLTCMLSFLGCRSEGNEVMEDFEGVITNINEDYTSYLVKVTDGGSSKLQINDRVIVHVEDDINAECSLNDVIKVEFNGVIEELTAVSMADKRISRVFAVERIDAKTDIE